MSTLITKLQCFRPRFNINSMTSRLIHEPTHLKHETSDEPQEVRIKVPWGHIAGKWWGPKSGRPIVCMHGWQDNAGTFDTLIPLLPKHVGYLAIDFPGHGFSSRIPDGLYYNNFESVTLLKHIQKIYNWEKISLLAHSMGSIIGFMYSGFYPDAVDMYIGIDALKPHVREAKHYVKRMPDYVESLILADERNRSKIEPPSYTYDVCVEKLSKGTFNSITPEAAPYLLERNLGKSELHPDQYYFTRDNRLKSMISVLMTQEMSLEVAKRIKCPHMSIKATNSPYYEKEENYFQMLEYLKKNKPLFEHHLVEGTHHLHLTHPKSISGIISNFINKYRPIDEPEVTVNSKL